MFLIDHALGARVERALSRQLAGFIRSSRSLEPSLGADMLEAGGGCAAFAGPGHPLSRVAGLGFDGPVDGGVLDRIEDWCFARAEPCRVGASPLAHPSLFGELRARGYTLADLTNVYVRPVPGADEVLEAPSGVRVREASEADAELLERTLSLGFTGSPVPAPVMRHMPRIAFGCPGVRQFFGHVDGEAGPAGAGGMESAGDGVTLLFGTATVEAYRGRGVQTALLRHRLACARADPSCTLVVIQTRPGIPSERNIVRAGFRLMYTRPQLVRPVAARAG